MRSLTPPAFYSERASAYWSSTEYAPNTFSAWNFITLIGYQDTFDKDAVSYTWVISPGIIVDIPEPASLALMLAGLGLVGGLARQRRD